VEELPFDMHLRLDTSQPLAVALAEIRHALPAIEISAGA
jgi:hypothetical protein